MQQGPDFYGDLVYKFKKIIGRNDFSYQFIKNYYTLQTYRKYLKCDATVCVLSF